MDKNKIITTVFVVILIISDIFLVFGKGLVGPYIAIFAMLAIFSGVGLFIMVIISRKKENAKLKKRFEVFEGYRGNVVPNKICPICNTENKPKATYCKKCGNDLKDITCPICNTINSFDQKYCTKCEAILQNEKRHV
ncbi:MAG: zinc ribbon domain-containing protein [Candidatus Izimaplasma sp.]|nr:zinc ribbon domain-containing protein [Candidatus Izimaplasma bacterium]